MSPSAKLSAYLSRFKLQLGSNVVQKSGFSRTSVACECAYLPLHSRLDRFKARRVAVVAHDRRNAYFSVNVGDIAALFKINLCYGDHGLYGLILAHRYELIRQRQVGRRLAGGDNKHHHVQICQRRTDNAVFALVNAADNSALNGASVACTGGKPVLSEYSSRFELDNTAFGLHSVKSAKGFKYKPFFHSVRSFQTSACKSRCFAGAAVVL